MQLSICVLTLISLIVSVICRRKLSGLVRMLFPVSAPLLLLAFILSAALSAGARNNITEFDSVGVKVYFRQGYSSVQSDFRDNGLRLDDFLRSVKEMHADSSVRFTGVDISAFASPEGSYSMNVRLARKRAANIESQLRQNLPFLDDSLFNVRSGGINWAGLAQMVEESDMPYRDETLRILRDVPERTYRNGTLVDSRLKHLMDLRGGRPYWYMYRNFFPTLRMAGAYVVCTFERTITPEPDQSDQSDLSDSSDQSDQSDQSNLPDLPELPVVPEPAPAPLGYDRWAIKTDALYLAAGVTNVGIEYAFAPHWSIDLPLVYSPYTLARDYRMRFLFVQPELRYWLGRPMNGHFFGAHFHGGVFNVSVDNSTRCQSEKGFHGAGISYGYSLPFARRWSAEFTIGLGYVFTRYSRYYNVPNGMRFEKDVPYHYWGPTRLGVNIVYRFGDRSAARKEVTLP